MLLRETDCHEVVIRVMPFLIQRLAGIPGIDGRVGESLVGKHVVFEELLCGLFGEAAIDYTILKGGRVRA